MSDEYLKYLNIARENPQYFIPIIQQQIDSFINDRQMPLAEGMLYEANEGKSVWKQAKAFLKAQKPIPPFTKHPGLCKAASEHRADLCTHGTFGHRGTDGSSFSKRILRYCKKGPGAMAEIIGADFDIKGRNTPEMTVLSLIIDDGVKDRGHRKTIFSPTYRYVGWSSGKHEEKTITVFNLTQNYYEMIMGSTGDSFRTTTEKSKTPSKSQKLNSTHESQMGKDITNCNFTASKEDDKSNAFSSTNATDFSKFGTRKGKKVTEKMENNKTYYEEGGAKVFETSTKFFYNDGSVEENVDRRTLYVDQ